MSDQPNHADAEVSPDRAGASTALPGTLLPIEQIVAPRRPVIARGDAEDSDRESPASTGRGLTGYLHAFRRHWFLAICVGLAGGAMAGSAAWFSAETTYTASALIHVASNEQSVAFSNEETHDSHSSFEIYKNTQAELLISPSVLLAASRLREVSNRAVLKLEEDPVRWLAKSLQVEAPPSSEIMRVSLKTVDKDDSAAIVEAVVGAYMTDVVDVERSRRAKRLEQLNSVFNDKESEMRRRRADLKKLAGQLGSGDMVALSVKQQLSLQQFAESRNEFTRLHGELQRAQGVLVAKLAAINAKEEKPASPADVENAVNSDSVCVRLQEGLAQIDTQLDEAKSKVKEKGALGKSLTERYTQLRKALETQLATRRKQLAERLKTMKLGDADSLKIEANDLQTQIASLAEQERQAAQDREDHKQEAEKFGNSSIDVEMMRAEIQGLEKVLNAVADERQRLRIEIGSQPRIEVYQHAFPPVAPDKSSRLQKTIVLAGFGFMAPVCLLLWWDVRSRRINSFSDISEGLGLRVIGTVPHMADTAFSRIQPGSRRQRRMQICVDQSIDGIAAKLFLRRDGRRARVVLVSSATRGEGKSTLSIQLAKRLARTGASTLLIDFDLRKPSLHHVFDMTRGPGISEFLRGESDLGPIIRQTDIENLSLLTAGSPFMDSLGALSNGVTGALFEKVRGEYEFVVVDGSPILPVVDALLTSQHVDSVVLSIRRDVSEAPRVRAACDQLAAFGVEDFVTVLTGSNEDLYYYGDHEPVGLVLEEKTKPR